MKGLWIFTCSVLGLTPIAFGQTLSRHVVSNGGSTYKSPTGSIQYTIGQPFIASVEDNTYQFTLGFHQFTIRNITNAESPNVKYLQAYPNPVEKELTVKLDDSSLVTDWQLTNANGIAVSITFSHMDSGRILDLGNLSSGVYFLHITTSTGKTAIIKIIKE